MGPEQPEGHLSRISTEWNLVDQAHCGDAEQVAAAQAALLKRYGGAIHRYLLGVVRDPDAVADLGQEFALRFLRGDFHRADPSRGRFRDFLKTSLRNLMLVHFRRERSRRNTDLSKVAEPASPETVVETIDRHFLECWREELLAHAWEALGRYERETGRPYHRVLRLRADQAGLRSPEMAERLGAVLGKPVSAGWVRQTLHLAREKFAGLLLDEVESSLGYSKPGALEDELADLGLYEFCRSALERRNGSP